MTEPDCSAIELERNEREGATHQHPEVRGTVARPVTFSQEWLDAPIDWKRNDS